MTYKTVYNPTDTQSPDFSGFPDITDIDALKQEHAKQIAALKLAHENISGKLAEERKYSKRCADAMVRDQRQLRGCEGQVFAVQAAPWWQRLGYLFARRLPQ